MRPRRDAELLRLEEDRLDEAVRRFGECAARLEDEPARLDDERALDDRPALDARLLVPDGRDEEILPVDALRRPGEVVRARRAGDGAGAAGSRRLEGWPALSCWIRSFKAAMRPPSCSSSSSPSCFRACGNISPSSSST